MSKVQSEISTSAWTPWCALTAHFAQRIQGKPRWLAEYKFLIHTLKKIIYMNHYKKPKRRGEAESFYWAWPESHPDAAAERQPWLGNALKLFEVLLPVHMTEMLNILIARVTVLAFERSINISQVEGSIVSSNSDECFHGDRSLRGCSKETAILPGKQNIIRRCQLGQASTRTSPAVLRLLRQQCSGPAPAAVHVVFTSLTLFSSAWFIYVLCFAQQLQSACFPGLYCQAGVQKLQAL